MSTIDSLVKFKYKKKFSFRGQQDDEDEDNNNNNEEAQSTSEEEEEEKIEKKSSVLKGSAQLKKPAAKKKKNSDSSYSESNSDDDDSDRGKSSKTKKKRIVQVKKSSDEEEEEKNDKQLKKIVKLFPDYSETKIKKAFKESKFNAKKCIDLLVADDDEGKKSDPEIEEWSDGDEAIRERNRKDKEEKRVKTLASSSSSASSLKSDDTNKSESVVNRKRKFSSDVEIVEKKKQPPKKARRVVLESDDDDEDTRSSSKTSSSSTSSSSSSVAKNGAKTNGHDSSKENHNLNESTAVENEDNLDDSDFRPAKHHHKMGKKPKKSKKDKKKKKKKSRNRSESEGEGDGDESEFADSDGESDRGSEDEDGFHLKDSEKDRLVNFFNKMSLEEFQSLVTTTKNKLESVISLRPFRTFNDLKNKLREKSLINLINSVKDALEARDMVDALFDKCESISSKMEQKVESLISGSKNSDLEIKYQPKNLNKALSLKPYQLIGLNWLCLMHKEKINAILADEMGLGKTCQTIAFLAYLQQNSPHVTHLIVVPPSTLDNWVREISTWCPGFYFTAYQGSLEERKVIRYNVLHNKFEKPLNAILTTYTMLISTNEDKAFFKKLDVGYVIYDEAHMLKNMNSMRYQGLIKIKSKGKLLLTGTPLQNNLVELMSLLYFVMPSMFHHKIDHIKQVFSFSGRADPGEKDIYYKKKIEQAKGIMRPFILRRVKADVLKQLPKKTEEIIYCDMTKNQAKSYEELISYYKKRKDALLKEIEAKKEAAAAKVAAAEAARGNKAAELLQEISDIAASCSHLGSRKDHKKVEKNENEDSSNNILMELRKTANHPLLRRVFYDDEKIKKMAKIITQEQSGDTVLEYVIEDLSVMNDFQIHKLIPLYEGLSGFALKNEQILDSGKIIVLTSLLEEKRDLGEKVLIFSQFVIALDILEEFMKIKKYKYLRLDGTTPVNERQDMIDCFNHDKEVFVFLLSTKAGGMGINLTAANNVILHDIDFNPFNDKQAEDRCHRVGQTKEVQVYKLLSKDSIDESMLRVQQRKISLGMDLSGENDDAQTTKADMVSLLKEALKI